MGSCIFVNESESEIQSVKNQLSDNPKLKQLTQSEYCWGEMGEDGKDHQVGFFQILLKKSIGVYYVLIPSRNN